MRPFVRGKIHAFGGYLVKTRARFGKVIPRLILIRRRISSVCFTRMSGWFLRLTVFLRKLRTVAARVAIMLSGLVASAGLLCIPEVRKVVNDFKPLEGILAQLGATFGTILALVLTLSITPIQRAGEVWSPSIIRLYRRDRATHVSFVTLGIFCIACFVFAIRGLAGIQVSVALAGAVLMLGIGLDLLRWYHGHVCQRLDPIYAVQLEFQRAKETIDRIQGSRHSGLSAPS